MVASIKYLAAAAFVAGAARAMEPPKPTTTVGWSPVTTPVKYMPGCDPWEEEYICDDEEGKEHLVTYTMYSSGCPGYTEWKEMEPHTKKPKEPKPTWGPVYTTKSADPATWDPYYTTPKATWAPYPTTKPKDPETWDPVTWESYKEPKKVVVVTLTETYVVPCPTGWTTTETVWYTTHCGCKETPMPEHPPMSTYTTTCPESWGVGKTVTVTVPAPTWTPDAASTWMAYYTTTPKYVADTSSTWITWAKPTTSSYPDGYATWSAYSTPVKGYTTTPVQSWSPIATYKGAASSSTVSKAMVLVGGAVAGLAFFL